MITAHSKRIKFSVLIPSIPSRFDRAKELCGKIEGQIGERDDVEVIILIDNKIRTIGEKRNDIKSLVRGEYFSMIDDDDDVSDNYIESILDAISKYNVDVITFDSMAIVDGKEGIVNMSLFNKTEQWSPERLTRRPPYHMCAWKTMKFKNIQFSNKMYGEDADFSNDAVKIATTEHHIDAILHYYIWDANVTEAFDRL